jgi:hypothetical protein
VDVHHIKSEGFPKTPRHIPAKLAAAKGSLNFSILKSNAEPNGAVLLCSCAPRDNRTFPAATSAETLGANSKVLMTSFSLGM